MFECFNTFNLLTEQQYDYCNKKHSTEYAAIEIIDHASKEIEPSNTPGNVYY